jgi:hypothetical protein
MVLTAALAASGCGSSHPAGSQTAAKLMPQVEALAQHAHSVHIVGTVHHNSQTVTVNLSFSGNYTAGTVHVADASVTLLSLSAGAFVKVTASFLKLAKLPTSNCAKICGKYVELPASAVSQLTGSFTLHSFVSQAFSKKNNNLAVNSGCVFTPAQVNGISVLQCREGGVTVDVAAHGKPYLLYITGHGDNIAFSDWNSVVMPTPPPASKVINAGQLGG